MEQTVLSDEVLFALFKLIPPLETGKYISVSKKWSTIIIDNELWRSYCEQRWRVLPSEKDIAKNWIIPTIKHDNKAIRIDWHKYYLLRNANDRQMVAVKKFAEAAKSQARNKKIQIVDPFAKTGMIEFKEVKKSLKVLHSVVNHWMDRVDLDDEEINLGGRHILEPPGSIMDILNFSVDLELHMASKTNNITRVSSLQFTSDFLLNVQACLELVEMPQLELQITTRLVHACKEYYRIGLHQALPVDTVSEFYLATIEMISACRSFKQRKTQLNLLLQVLGIIADSLTDWQTSDTWHDWCNSRLLDDDDAQSPLGGFLNALKSGASTAGSRPWYSFLSNYAAQHYPPKLAREQLTLFMIFACEVNHITPYLSKYKDEIIPKYFEPILWSENDEMMVPFLFMYESVATYVEIGFIERLADLALPRITALLTQGSDGVILLAESALIATLNNRVVDQLPNLAKHLTPALVEALLSLMKSSVKTIVKQAADAITCLFSFIPQLYNEELEAKIGAAFQNVNPEFAQSVLPNLVELSSVVEVVSLPGVTEAFNQTLAAYSNTENADPNPILRMTQFISFSTKPSQVLVDALPAIMPIIINVITQNVAAGFENMFGIEVHDNEEEEVELEVPNEFLALTDRRFENKSAAFASLTNMLNNMPPNVITPLLAPIGNTLVSAISAVASEEILKDLRSSLTALAGFVHRNNPNELQQLIELIWQTARNSENLMTYPDVILNHLIDLQKFLSTNAPHILPAILPATLDIIRPLIDVTTTIDENDSVASGNLGYGELTMLFENVVTFAPDKKFILESVKPFFQAFELELKLPNPESWTVYDMISVVYEQCGSELTPEDTFGFMKYLWAARVLDTRYVSQTVAYTLCTYIYSYSILWLVANESSTAFLARDHPELLPDTLEECINWTLRWLNTPNIREENAAVYDNVLVAFGRLINLYKEDQEWLKQFTTFVKYLPPTEDGDATEGLDVLALFSEYVKRAETIGMDAQLRTDVERVQKEAEKYVPIFK